MKKNILLLSVIALFGISACSPFIGRHIPDRPSSSDEQSSSESSSSEESSSSSSSSSSSESESQETPEDIEAAAWQALNTVLAKMENQNYEITNQFWSERPVFYLLGKEKGLVTGYHSTTDFNQSNRRLYAYVPSEKGIMLFTDWRTYSEELEEADFMYSGMIGETSSLQEAQEAIYTTYYDDLTIKSEEMTFRKRTNMDYIFDYNASASVRRALLHASGVIIDKDNYESQTNEYVDTIEVFVPRGANQIRLNLNLKEQNQQYYDDYNFASLTFHNFNRVRSNNLDYAVNQVISDPYFHGDYSEEQKGKFAYISHLPFPSGCESLNVRVSDYYFNNGYCSNYAVTFNGVGDISATYATLLEADTDHFVKRTDSSDGSIYYEHFRDSEYGPQPNGTLTFKYYSSSELGDKGRFNPNGIFVVSARNFYK